MEAWLCIDQRAMDDSGEWEEQITPWATVSRLHPSWWERPVQCGTPQPAAAHFLTETAVWALQSWPRWWMASTAGERKEKGAWESSEDQYVRTGEPASHVKNPNPAPSPPARSLRCLLHHWRTSLWETVGGELRLRREDFGVCVCLGACVSTWSVSAGF